MNKFRLLKADEIECRIAMIKETGLSLLLYKDARVDQNLLDETVGCLNWQRSHQVIDGNLYCTISIWDSEKNQWISKQDVGTESYTEKEKGQASDSFKRAAFNFGIGRELYTAPFIWVPSDKCEIKNGKCFEKFKVKDIGYNDNREINSLTIVNQKGNVVYSMGKKIAESKSAEDSIGEMTIGDVKVKALKKQCKEDDVPLDLICTLYKVKDISELNEKQFANIHANWDKVKERAKA